MYWYLLSYGSFLKQDGVRPARPNSSPQPVRSIRLHYSSYLIIIGDYRALLYRFILHKHLSPTINTWSPVTYEALNPWVNYLQCLGAGGLCGSNKTGALLFYIEYTSFSRKKSSQNDSGRPLRLPWQHEVLQYCSHRNGSSGEKTSCSSYCWVLRLSHTVMQNAQKDQPLTGVGR